MDMNEQVKIWQIIHL